MFGESLGHNAIEAKEKHGIGEQVQQFIEALGGKATEDEIGEIYGKAINEGFERWVEGYKSARQTGGKPWGGELGSYSGSEEQKSLLLAFLRSRIVLQGYYWDAESNYLGKHKIEESPGGAQFVKEYIETKTGIDIKNLSATTMGRALEAVQKALLEWRDLVGGEIPIDFIADLLASPRGNVITIDDGPDENTPRILDILDKAGVRAIFYLIGENVKKYPEAARMIVERGHVIGYHTMTHVVGPESKMYTQEVLERDFTQFRALLNKVLKSDYPLIFMRMPGGRQTPYESYFKSREGNTGTPFAGTSYHARGNKEKRADNWDVYDNAFRDESWNIKDSEAKAMHYAESYRKGSRQVFLLHQQEDDVQALSRMLETP